MEIFEARVLRGNLSFWLKRKITNFENCVLFTGINIEIFRENKTPANINSNSNMAYFFIGNINNAVIEFLIYFALHMPIA
jgi:hypothetical protein